MHRVHENSRDTYHGITERLPRSRRAVFKMIELNGPLTRQDIADRLNKPINEITGRVRELLDSDLIEEKGTQRPPGKRPRALLHACPAQRVLEL